MRSLPPRGLVVVVPAPAVRSFNTSEGKAMSAADNDRLAVDEMTETFSIEERDAFALLNREVRRRSTPVTLHTNCESGESVSDTLSDEDVAQLERVRRDALERYRS